MNPKVKSHLTTAIIILLLAVAIVLVLGYMDIISHGRKVSEEKSNVNVQELSFYDGSEKIYGKLFLPDAENLTDEPTFIYVHGYGLNGDFGENICKAVAESGMPAYSFDFRGGGPESRSSGSMMEMSVETEIRDLEIVLDRIRKMPFADKKQIFLMGHSQGGLVATMAAARNKKEVAGLILMAPAFDIPKKGKELYRKASDIPDTSKVGRYYVGRNYYSDIRSLQPYKEMKGYKNPVLIIHGDGDTVVNLQWSDVAVQIMKDVRLEILEGCDHKFSGSGEKRAIELTRGFLREQTGQETAKQARERKKRIRQIIKNQ